MNWANKFEKARKAAEAIEKGVKTEVKVRENIPVLVKHYTVYSIQGLKEKPIAWRLYAADVEGIIAAAQRRLLRESEAVVESNSLLTAIRFEAREENICQTFQ